MGQNINKLKVYGFSECFYDEKEKMGLFRFSRFDFGFRMLFVVVQIIATFVTNV